MRRGVRGVVIVGLSALVLTGTGLTAGETQAGSGGAPPASAVRLVNAGTSSTNIEEPAAFSPGGRFLAVIGADGALRLLNTNTGVSRIKVDAFRSGAFSPNGRTFLVCSRGGPYGLRRDALSLWDLRRLVRLMDFGISGEAARNLVAATYSPNGDFIGTVDPDRSIRVWETMHGNQVFKISRMHHSEVPALFAPGGRQLATVGERDRMRLWDLSTGAARFDVSNFKNGLFSPDGKTLLVLKTDRRLVMLETSSARLLLDVTVERLLLESLEFSPDGSTLLTRSRDRTIRVWDTATGIQLYKLSDASEEQLEVRLGSAPSGWWVPDSMKLVWDVSGAAQEGETVKVMKTD